MLAACFFLASPDADPCTGNKEDEPSKVAEMREVEALKMSHWQQTTQADFLSPVVGSSFS